MHPLVHLRHEFMEVGAVLATDRARMEKQIHQHGLAAADVAVDVQPLDRFRLLAVAEQPAEQSVLAGGGAIVRKPRLERAQGIGGDSLRRIGFDFAGGHKRLILGLERGRLRSRHAALTA